MILTRSLRFNSYTQQICIDDAVVIDPERAENVVTMTENQEDTTFDSTAPGGPSQTVVYTSRFINKLSDITNDMSVSGSLSIKA